MTFKILSIFITNYSFIQNDQYSKLKRFLFECRETET